MFGHPHAAARGCCPSLIQDDVVFALEVQLENELSVRAHADLALVSTRAEHDGARQDKACA